MGTPAWKIHEINFPKYTSVIGNKQIQVTGTDFDLIYISGTTFKLQQSHVNVKFKRKQNQGNHLTDSEGQIPHSCTSSLSAHHPYLNT